MPRYRVMVDIHIRACGVEDADTPEAAKQAAEDYFRSTFDAVSVEAVEVIPSGTGPRRLMREYDYGPLDAVAPR